MNKLPEKLSLLRKNCELPQSEIAQKLMIPVSEYMNWENGNSIPDIEKLKKISEFYQIDLAALIDNTMTFVTPTVKAAPTNTQSATIPFQYGNGSFTETQQLTSLKTMNAGDTKEADFGKTKVMDTALIQKKTEEEEELFEEKRPNKKQTTKKNNTIMIVTGCIAAIVLFALVFLFFNRGTGTTVSMSNTNRLALTPTYSMYLQSNGTLKTRGTNYPTDSALKDIVQISARDDYALALKKDGTVYATDSSLDVSQWENVTEISAGNSHAVGLLSDGTVVCTGSESACNVSQWQDVQHIYAGNEITIAITKEGSFLSSGGVSIPSVTGVQGVTVSDNAMYYITSATGVAGIGLNGAETLSTTSLTSVTSLAAGDDFLAALLKDGTVKVISENEDYVKAVSEWKDVKYIAANGNTLIAITDDNEMYGMGDNTYNQYENTVTAQATPTASASTQLDAVTNVTFTETTEDVQITWDAVENADYYEVSISSISYSVNSMSTTASIPASSLDSGATYAVTIVAKSNDADQYEDSAPSTINYTYSQKTTQLDTPSGLSANLDDYNNWVISWGSVSNAASYTLYINDQIAETISGTSYTISGSNLINGSEYTISVKANSNDDKYTESGIARLTQTYSLPVIEPEPTAPPVEPEPENGEETDTTGE